MDDTEIKNSGPGFLADLIKRGATPVANGMTNEQLADFGGGFPSDLARQGGVVIEEEE